MPRIARASAGGVLYHVVDRGNGGAKVFGNERDYAEFLRLLPIVAEHVPMRTVAYCLMPNHLHFVLWPRADGDLGRWMGRLLTIHVRRHHSRHGTEGRIWQGRYKSFPIQKDDHLLTVLRYVERNPVRARLVDRAQDWPWSSLGSRADAGLLDDGPLPRGDDWLSWVNEPEPDEHLAAVRNCAMRGAPLGEPAWVTRTAKRLGIESTLRPRGRPRKG